jgi:hypothetical protein
MSPSWPINAFSQLSPLDISPVLWRNVYSTAGVFSSTPAVLPVTAVEGFYRLRVQSVKGAASHPSGTLFPTLQVPISLFSVSPGYSDNALSLQQYVQFILFWLFNVSV